VSGPAPRAPDARTRSIRLLNTADRLSLLALGALAAVDAFSGPAPLALLVPIAAVAVTLFALARLSAGSRAGALLHEFASPYLAVASVFELSSVSSERRSPARWDATLSSLDAHWFPALADQWRGALGRPAWLTDVASMAYVTFYALPLIVGVPLYLRGRRRDLDQFVVGVEVAFFTSYVGYVAFPARGPRVPLDREALVLGGSAVSASVRAFLRIAEISSVDAFPSGHTLVSLVILAFGWRLLPRWRAPLVSLVAVIVFSTVYLSYHYVTDVVAGALMALALAVVAGSATSLSRLMASAPQPFWPLRTPPREP
jgi:membrane-associated phospholipid phosphatase